MDAIRRAGRRVAAVNRHYDADVFLFSGAISEANYGALVGQLARPKLHPNALMIIATYGGYANAAFKIARLMHSQYSRFYLYVPRVCYSAGTLLALGAHRLIVDEFAELGPLDVQLPKPNEIGGRKSGLTSRSAFHSLGESTFTLFEYFMLQIKSKSGGAVSFDMAARLAAQMATALTGPVLAKMDPEVVGSDYRDLNVGSDYGLRLAKAGGNVRDGAVERLVSGYPAHDFIIDEQEARSLFVATERPAAPLYRLMGEIADLSYTPAFPSAIRKLEKPDAPPKPAKKLIPAPQTGRRKRS